MTASRRPYRTDLSDARWALIEPMLSEWRSRRVGLGIVKIQHELREIVNAILYINRSGAAWDLLPHDFPPHQTVYGYYSTWEKEGIVEQIHDALRNRVRASVGRDEQPTAALMDTQTVKTSANVAEEDQGIDPGKRIKGRKRHLTTDTLGLLLVLLVTAGNVHDTVGGRAMVDHIATHHPAVTKVWVDGTYQRSAIELGAKNNIDVTVVSKEPGQRGFKPQPKRWAIERTLGWLMLHRRLVRDYETLAARSRTMIHWAMIDVMSRRLTGETIPSWRVEPQEVDNKS
jgi:transposase